jgi:hypothetical protein
VPGYDPDEDDLDEQNRVVEFGFLDFDPADGTPGNHPARPLKPKALAAAPDGSLYLADWSSRWDQRPPWVFQLNPPDGTERDWRLWRLPVPGMADCGCPPGQIDFPVRKPHRLEVGDDGTVYILGHGLLWACTPLEPSGDEADPLWHWHWEAIAGPLAPKTLVAAWPPQGAPADELDPTILRRIRHMAAVPGGGLLLSDGVDGIRFLGPAADAALAERLRAHAQARLTSAAGPAPAAPAVPAGLERQRDAPIGLRFRGLCRAGTLAPCLGADVLGKIDAFLVDPKVLAFRAGMAARAFRAGMAARACRAGADPGPDPRQRILAQRHVWQVPGTLGATYESMAWEPLTGTLAAGFSGGMIRRLDPARGVDTVLLALPQAGDQPDSAGVPCPLSNQGIFSLAAGPGGALYCSTYPNKVPAAHGTGQVWRLTPQGELRQLAGRGTNPRPSGQDWEASSTMSLNPDGLAVGPAGEVYVADEENEMVLLLTPGADGERTEVQCIAQGEDNLTGAIALGENGEVLLGGVGYLMRLVPESGPDGRAWRREYIPELPESGTEGCAASYDPVWGIVTSRERDFHALAAGRDGAIHAGDVEHLWTFLPLPAPAGAAPRWRSQLVTVSGQHAMADGTWDTHPDSTLPVPADFWTNAIGLAAIPGGGLVVSISKKGGILLIGPPGDGALFAQVRAFQKAEADRDWPRARRILGALLRQRRLAAPEACDLPFHALARSGPGGAAPHLGPLPRTLQRLVGSFLVRPQVMAFRAGVAAEAILAQSAWARAWVAAGCLGEEAQDAGSGSPQGGKRQRMEERKEPPSA